MLLRIISNPLANVFQKKLTLKGVHPFAINFFTYLCLSVGCIFFALNIKWIQLPNEFWIFSVLGGIAGALGNGFLVKALQTGDLSVLGPVNAYKSVIGIIAGIFFLGEIPNVPGIAGILLIISGSYFVLGTTQSGFSPAIFKNKEIQYRIYALILTATEAVFIKKVIQSSSATISFISWCWSGAFFSFFLLFFVNEKERNEWKQARFVNFRKIIRLVIYIVSGIGIMQMTTIYTLENMSVGYALSLFQLSIILSVVLGYKFFNEQGILKKIVGCVIMIAGSVIIIIFKNK